MAEDDDTKRANWLELFFDLVFVYAIAKATHVIGHPHEGHVLLKDYGFFILIVIPIWVAWTGHTLFTTRFDTEDPTHRLLTLAQMLAALFLAAFISPDFAGTYVGFLTSYITIRLILIVMYLRVASRRHDARAAASSTATGFGLGVLIMASSTLLDPPIRYFVVYAGILVEVLTPRLLTSRLVAFPVGSHHLPERFGLFTIILLGESVVALGSTMSEGELTAIVALAAVMGFVILATTWWIYFNLTEEHLVGHHLGHPKRIVNGHFPLVVGLPVLANFVRFALTGELNILDHAQMGILGVALVLGGLWWIHGKSLWGSFQSRVAILALLVGSTVLIVLGGVAIDGHGGGMH